MRIEGVFDGPTIIALGAGVKCSTCDDYVEKLWKIDKDSMCRNCVQAWVQLEINDQIDWAFEQAACVAFNRAQDNQLYKLIKSLNRIDGAELREQVERGAVARAMEESDEPR